MPVPALKKELSAYQLFTLGFGSIIGVGWIILVGDWLAGAGTMGTIIAFFLGGLGIAMIGLCYCEAVTRFPVAGGEVAYCYAFFGLKTAFAAGWIVVLTFTVGTAFEAIAVGWLLSVIFPDISGPVLYSLWGEEVYAGQLAAGLAVMVGVGVINWIGIKATSRLQDLITYGLLVVTLVCVAVALWAGDVGNLAPLFVMDESGSFMGGVLGVLAMIPLFYLGFNVIPQALGEKADNVGTRQVSIAIIAAIFGAMLFYIAVIVMTAIAMPRTELLGNDLAAYAAISAALGSTTAGKVVLVAGLLGLISSWNAIFFAATRLLLVLARIGTIPMAFSAIHTKHGTPHNAIILVVVIGGLGTLLGPGGLVPMINALGTAMSLVFGMIALGVLISPCPADGRSFFRGRAAKLVPVAAGLISVCLFFVGLYQAYVASESFPPREWMLLLVWLVLGLAFWHSVRGTRRSISEEAREHILLSDAEELQGDPAPRDPSISEIAHNEGLL